MTARIPGRFAIDWIRLLPSGRGGGRHPCADASGKPRETVSRENAAGNYIALDLGNGRFTFYEHLQQGSVGVKAGDRVARGQVIARV